MSDSLIIIPTYNEKENVANMLRKVFSLEKPYHVLIVDDGSPDGTAAIVKSLQAEFPERLFVEERSGKLGLGTALFGDGGRPGQIGPLRGLPDQIRSATGHRGAGARPR